MRTPAPVHSPLRIGDFDSRITSPAWIEWFQRLSDYYDAAPKFIDPKSAFFGQSEPPVLSEGLLAYADGTNWDPAGTGKAGIYIYEGGAWKFTGAIMPASAVTSGTAFGALVAVGTSLLYARADHSHGTPSDPIPAHVAAVDPHTQYATNVEFDDHSARHENGGADEISIAGLSGEAADPQPPKTHGAAAHSGDIGAITQITGRAYGNMYAYNLGPGGTTVTVSASDTWYEVGSGISGGTCSGFTFQNNKELKCVTPGIYLLVWSLSVECASANQEVEATIMKGGAAQTPFASHCELITANKPQTLCGNGIIALIADDLISLAVLNHTAGNNVVIDHINLSLHRVA